VIGRKHRRLGPHHERETESQDASGSEVRQALNQWWQQQCCGHEGGSEHLARRGSDDVGMNSPALFDWHDSLAEREHELADITEYGSGQTSTARGRRSTGSSARHAAFLRYTCESMYFYLQRLALSGDSADVVQPNELRGSGRACHRNGRASVRGFCQLVASRDCG
jgi:hypothetical protein